MMTHPVYVYDGIPVAPEKVARYYLSLKSGLWYDEFSEFEGQREIAERLLQEWCDTGKFPTVYGKWMGFKNQFIEWLIKLE